MKQKCHIGVAAALFREYRNAIVVCNDMADLEWISGRLFGVKLDKRKVHHVKVFKDLAANKAKGKSHA